MKLPFKLNPFAIDDGDDEYLTFRATEPNSMIKIAKNGTVNTNNLYYSKNNGDWTLYTINQEIYINPGDNLRFWNENTTLGTSNSNYLNFAMSGTIKGSRKYSVSS